MSKYVSVSPTGGVFYVDNIKDFCNPRGLSVDGFKKCLRYKQKSFSEGWASYYFENYVKKQSSVENEDISYVWNKEELWFSADDCAKVFGYLVKDGKAPAVYDSSSKIGNIHPMYFQGKRKYWNYSAICKFKHSLLSNHMKDLDEAKWNEFLLKLESIKLDVIQGKSQDKLPVMTDNIQILKAKIDDLEFKNLELTINLKRETMRAETLFNSLYKKVIITYTKGFIKRDKVEMVISVGELKEYLTNILQAGHTVISVE